MFPVFLHLRNGVTNLSDAFYLYQRFRLTFRALDLRKSESIDSDEGRAEARSGLLQFFPWLVRLTDLVVVDNLFYCFTFPSTQRTVSFETNFLISGLLFQEVRLLIGKAFRKTDSILEENLVNLKAVS